MPRGRKPAEGERYTVQVRVSEQERGRFERAALDAGLTLSEWARMALRAAAGLWTGQAAVESDHEP